MLHVKESRNCLTKSIAIGILGATVMPHALFLGSALGTLDRVGGPSVSLPVNVPPSESRYRRFIKYVRSWFYLSGYVEEGAPDRTTRHENRNNNSYEFVSAHLNHGMVDISKSLSRGYKDKIDAKSSISSHESIVFRYPD